MSERFFCRNIRPISRIFAKIIQILRKNCSVKILITPRLFHFTPVVASTAAALKPNLVAILFFFVQDPIQVKIDIG